MSTADSQLLVTSSALTEDVYRAFLDKEASQQRLLWIGRGTTVAVALFAYVLALGGGTVLDLVAYAWAGFGAAFGPVIVLSLYWSRMTAAGALAGMVVGAGSVVLFANVIDTGVYEIVPGVVLATIAVVAVSRFTTPPERSWAHEDTLTAELA